MAQKNENKYVRKIEQDAESSGHEDSVDEGLQHLSPVHLDDVIIDDDDSHDDEECETCQHWIHMPI